VRRPLPHVLHFVPRHMFLPIGSSKINTSVLGVPLSINGIHDWRNASRLPNHTSLVIQYCRWRMSRLENRSTLTRFHPAGCFTTPGKGLLHLYHTLTSTRSIPGTNHSTTPAMTFRSSAKDLAQSCTYVPKIYLSSNQNGAPG